MAVSEVEYIIDTRYENCTFRQITSGKGGSEKDSTLDPHYLFLREGLEMFDLPNKELTYQGRVGSGRRWTSRVVSVCSV